MSKIQIVGVLNPCSVIQIESCKSCCWNQAALQGGWSHVLCCSEAIKSVEDWLFRACKDKMQSQPACMKLNQIWATEVVKKWFPWKFSSSPIWLGCQKETQLAFISRTDVTRLLVFKTELHLGFFFLVLYMLFVPQHSIITVAPLKMRSLQLLHEIYVLSCMDFDIEAYVSHLIILIANSIIAHH